MTNIVVSGSGLYTPPHSISNDELVKSFNQYVDAYNARYSKQIADCSMTALEYSSSEFILKASGIESRYVVEKAGILDPERMRPNIPERADDELGLLAEFGVNAAREALQSAGRAPGDVDLVIVACSNLQRAYPAIAIEVQQHLGCGGYGYDMNIACSSATFGIGAAADAIRSGTARCALVISPEITSAQLGTRFKTEFSNNIRNNFGFMNHCQPEKQDNSDRLFRQNGRKVFKELLPLVGRVNQEHLERMGLRPADLKRFWLHQANLTMNMFAAKKLLGREPDTQELPIILDRYANTSSAGSIIAFHLYSDDFKSREKGLLSSFGAGYSVGSVILERC
ncbi:MAG: ketoacyl-ACP synthase III [Candidatus Thiodiazotropha sp.]